MFASVINMRQIHVHTYSKHGKYRTCSLEWQMRHLPLCFWWKHVFASYLPHWHTWANPSFVCTVKAKPKGRNIWCLVESEGGGWRLHNRSDLQKTTLFAQGETLKVNILENERKLSWKSTNQQKVNELHKKLARKSFHSLPLPTPFLKSDDLPLSAPIQGNWRKTQTNT